MPSEFATDAFERSPRRPASKAPPGLGALVCGVVGLVISGFVAYSNCRIDVGTGQMAVLIRKSGLDVTNADEIAPTEKHKGVQRKVLTEGRYFYNPYVWDWRVMDQASIPAGKMGVLVSLTGEDLKYGEFIGQLDAESVGLGEFIPLKKGIIPEVLTSGRKIINPYLFKLEEHEPVIIDPGFRGVVTNLTGPTPAVANTLLAVKGERGVQPETLGEGSHYVNPYMTRINKVDCRSKRFNLAETKAFGFPSKDGFWVSLDGRIQFRIMPKQAPEVYVTYNESANGDDVDEEIVRDIILPNARSFCRLKGSAKLGKEFIDGKTRTIFEAEFAKAMKDACEPLGIEIQEALITTIRPPEQIAKPIQERESSRLEEKKYAEQIKQQKAERSLAEQIALVKQKPALVEVDQKIVKIVTQAKREQEVAVTKANEQLAVAKLKLDAAKDEAAAIISRGEADAAVIGFENKADAAGWKQSVTAFDGNGLAFAQYVLNQKLSAAYRRIMINTQDSPLMKMFDGVGEKSELSPAATKAADSKPADGK